MNAGNRKRGLLLNLTGDGKGKTSSALGMVVRSLGYGKKCAVIQFIKGSAETGEKKFFRTHFPDMPFLSGGLGFTKLPGDHGEAARRTWETAKKFLCEEGLDLLVLDEFNLVLASGWVGTDEALRLLAARPDSLSVVVTGRSAPPGLLALSDTVSEVVEIKHAFRSGRPAEPGIDF